MISLSSRLHTKQLVFVIFILGLLNIAMLLLFANYRVLAYASDIHTIDQIEPTEYALVFGGGVNPNGTQSTMQRDRVSTAVSAYLNNTANILIMTGDDGANRFDEVSLMYDQAIDLGVPETNVQLDPHGYRTYESCWRAANVYDIDQAIVVSQNFHLPRIIYICKQLGVDVVGLAADVQVYQGGLWSSGIREVLARLKAVVQVEVTKPLPRVTY
jgi:vancomycin permeability regulator SanA